MPSTRETPPSTGVSTAPRSDGPRYGWRDLVDTDAIIYDLIGHEGQLAETLSQAGLTTNRAGSRHQRYDLEVVTDPMEELVAGRYEVKSLHRGKGRRKFDRRFKTGSRGESIYGRRDAQIKSLALDIEEMLEQNWTAGVVPTEQVMEFIDDALERRHSKSFLRGFTIVAEAYDDVLSLRSAKTFLGNQGVQGEDIVRGFSDIEGIFILAGHNYTLVSRTEFPSFFEFDSVSVEGVKLRFQGTIPSENVAGKVKG